MQGVNDRVGFVNAQLGCRQNAFYSALSGRSEERGI